MVFDLDDDIGETNDISDKQIEKAGSLQKAYQQWESELQGPAFPYLGSWKKNRPKNQGKNRNKNTNKSKKKNKGVNK